MKYEHFNMYNAFKVVQFNRLLCTLASEWYSCAESCSDMSIYGILLYWTEI